jgi:hypothetical protein
MDRAPVGYEGPTAFDDWMTDMIHMVILLADLLPEDVVLDFAPASLAEVEVELISRYEQRAELEQDEERALVSGSARSFSRTSTWWTSGSISSRTRG